ncbi:hypothetical protein Gotri_027491, partial [Gossypium trilobum]|nr:hypothetical protein [Gossypium trilobum]
WNHSASYVGIPTALEDIRLLLNQRSETHIARGTIADIISFPIPIALWDSNTSAVGYANTSAFFTLSKWVILPTPTTRATTTPTES